ncbi:MAG: ComEC/Rec2 family competence protein [Pseudomonadota bacterium]
MLGLLGLASVCLLAPPGLALRRYGLLALLLVVVAGQPRRPPLQVTVLDVGQGLATVVETAGHVLVYDAGPVFGERFDAGADIVAHYLRRRGWRQLDVLLVSHEDLDHSGGVAGLVREYPPRRALRGMPVRDPAPGTELCRAGQHWSWDGVQFRILHPPGREGRDNDRSCVLLVEFGAARVLLTGDIERRSEAALLADGRLPAGVALLVAPHHGSRSSSSPAFVARTRPRHVVYSAGHRHHFGHPHPEVVARYAEAGARAWHTATAGAVQFLWRDPDAAEAVEIHAARAARRRYWDGG